MSFRTRNGFNHKKKLHYPYHFCFFYASIISPRDYNPLNE
jgi:hypothetical protein